MIKSHNHTLKRINREISHGLSDISQLINKNDIYVKEEINEWRNTWEVILTNVMLNWLNLTDILELPRSTSPSLKVSISVNFNNLKTPHTL